MDSMAVDLLRVASKYDIAGLSAVCEAYLCEVLTVATAVDTLVLADTLGLFEMKEKIKRY